MRRRGERTVCGAVRRCFAKTGWRGIANGTSSSAQGVYGKSSNGDGVNSFFSGGSTHAGAGDFAESNNTFGLPTAVAIISLDAALAASSLA
jgi:hypothetical protein